MRRLATLAALALEACSGGSSGTQPSADQTLAIGPIPVAAGQETTVCIVVPFGNAEDVVVSGIDVSLARGSHHLIVYQTDAAPAATPFACAPFQDVAFGKDSPVILANKEDVHFTFPSGVGQEIPANAMMKIEAHYINATASTLQGRGQVVFHATPKAKASAFQPANFTFWGTFQINVPPNSSTSTGKLFQAGIAGTHLIDITTHQHRLGTGIQVWESKAPGDVGTQIANDPDWANPAWSALSPQYDFDGTNGLSWQCHWTNTTTQAVQFGESALDEMCFVGGYYYPATKLDLCFDGNCKNR